MTSVIFSGSCEVLLHSEDPAVYVLSPFRFIGFKSEISSNKVDGE